MSKKVSEAKLPPVLQTAPSDIADAIAMQALAHGGADAGQQQRALKWIIYKACGFNDVSFRPGAADETAFAEGKRFVAQQINLLLTQNTRNISEDR